MFVVVTLLIFKVNVKVTLKIATRPAIKFKKKTAKIKKHTNKKNLQNYLLFRISYIHTHTHSPQERKYWIRRHKFKGTYIYQPRTSPLVSHLLFFVGMKICYHDSCFYFLEIIPIIRWTDWLCDNCSSKKKRKNWTCKIEQLIPNVVSRFPIQNCD